MNDGMDEDESGASSSGTLGPEIIPYNPRASRNLAEKQRRDNLNTNISTMAALVPTVAGSSRRMDKISILRLAAAFLRTQYTLGRSTTNYFPPQLNDFDLEQYFVDYLVGSGGFFLVVTTKGKIVYVSRQVEQHLGHVQNELLGQSLYNFVYPGDYKTLMDNLTPDGMQPIHPSQNGSGAQAGAGSELTHDSNSSSSEDSATNQRINERPKSFCEQRRSFQIRMSQRTSSKREQPQYERFDISGVLRLAEACKNADSNRGKHRESTSNDIVFAGVVTLPKKRPITELSIMDANKNEYVTRHLLDGHIIYCDHRVSVVAGYMSEEVTGANAFKFMHKDDSKWTILGLRQMYDRSEPYGSSCYRLLTKTGNYIYLRTHGYLEYDKDTQKMISFVCINTLVSEDEGIKLMEDMKRRFSAVSGANRFLQDADQVTTVVESSNASPPSSSKSDIEDSTLEDYIAYLIDGLTSPVISDDHFLHSPDALPYARTATLSAYIMQGNGICGSDKNNRYNRYLQDKEHKVKQEHNSSEKQRRSSVSDTEDVKPLKETLLTSDDVNVVAHSNRGNIQAAAFVQSVLVTRKSGNKSRRSYATCLDVAQNAQNVPDVQRVDCVNANVLSSSILYGGVAGNIKMEPGIGRFIRLDKQSSVLHYFGDDDSIVTAAGIKMHERWPLKRIYSEEDLLQTKKRSGEAYASTSASDECQDYGNSFNAENEYPRAVSADLGNQRSNAPQLTTTESAGLGPSDAGDYQQQIEPATTSLEVTNSELGMLDLADLKEDLLLSSDLEADPELMMKIFDTLNNGTTTNLDDNPVKANVQQLVPDDQAVNDEIRRTYHQLANSMALRESQINVLARDLENPALCAQRKNLSQLQAEHNIQKQMLKTLQQDHRKMQVNAKQNVEV